MKDVAMFIILSWLLLVSFYVGLGVDREQAIGVCQKGDFSSIHSLMKAGLGSGFKWVEARDYVDSQVIIIGHSVSWTRECSYFPTLGQPKK